MGQVLLETQDGVARLVLDAPPMNTLDRAMVSRLGELLEQCAKDDGVRVLVVHGAGQRAFCAGSDLGELQQLIAAGRDALAVKFEQDQQVFSALADFPKPTLAAIEGAAVGGGLELAVCCDLVVCARGTKLSLPEIRLGVFPGSGGTLRVTRRIGAARAKRMMLFGDSVDASTAHAWGLVDELCDDGTALEVARTMGARLAQGPSLAQQGCKAAIAAALEGPQAAAHELANRWAVDLGFSGDLAEGLRAFQEKRRPVFGRKA